jgi:hypothetical protein
MVFMKIRLVSLGHRPRFLVMKLGYAAMTHLFLVVDVDSRVDHRVLLADSLLPANDRVPRERED